LTAYVLDLWNDFSGITSDQTFGELLDTNLKDKTVKDLMNYSQTNEFHPIDHKATFKEVLETLTLPGVHRVPLLNKKSQFGSFVTQSEVLRFIATNLDEFGPLLDKTLMEAGIGTMFVKKTPQTSTAIEAFRTMIANKVSAVPIVDPNDHIVGVVSVRDIRTLVGQKYNTNLNQPLLKFIEEIRKDNAAPPRAIVGSLTDKVRDVITRIHSNRIHRIFLLDVNDRVSGVVSIVDILKFIIENETEMKINKQTEREKEVEKMHKEAERKKGKKELEKEKRILKKYVVEALHSDSE